YKEWLKKEMKSFKKFVHKRKKERRRKDETLPQRPYFEALETFTKLMDEINSFNKPIQKRLRKIEKHWEKFTIFYFVEGAPATNNLLENYYSTSLKTHRKKQLRTDRGITNHMKLSAMKRAGLIINSGKTILQMFLKFTPFLNHD
ncbi:MAG: ISNCY family transposase, partial [Euryarchaeota archaeon]|nr:ISNCY family transposase [Euryarchaeota archaeon]